MSLLSYTTGNPNNLTGGATASMNDIQGPFTDVKTWANGNVDSSNLVVGPNLIATQQAWQTVAVAATNWLGGSLPYYKNSLGEVIIRTDTNLATSTGTSGTTALFGTLPAGYRPAQTQYFSCQSLSASPGVVSALVVSVAANGEMRFHNGLNSGFVPVLTIRFRAEN